MTGWVARLRDRPIAEHERPGALVLVALALTGATLLLALTRPVLHDPPAAADPPSTRHTTARAPTAPVLSAEVERASRAFLAGYLAYTYGHAPASQVRGATPALVRSLKSHPPRVTPAIRVRHPRVVSLHATVASDGTVAVGALVNDGELIEYPLELRLAPRDRGLLVNEVGQG